MTESTQSTPSFPSTTLRSALKHTSPSLTPLSSSSVASSSQVSEYPWRSLASVRTGSSTATPNDLGAVYLSKVSFDTFENPASSLFSYTLQVKSEGYRRNRGTRIFLCAASPDESGSQALDWVMEDLVQDGDELIALRGYDTEELDKDHDAARDDAKDLMKQIQRLNTEYDPDRKLSIIVELVAGKVTETIDRLIALYRPDSLVVGTRGLRGMKVWGAAFGAMGSVSKYCLSHSPVPVIVVRPERKVRKAMEKRRADPKRGTHFEGDKSPGPDPASKSPRVIPQ